LQANHKTTSQSGYLINFYTGDSLLTVQTSSVCCWSKIFCCSKNM